MEIPAKFRLKKARRRLELKTLQADDDRSLMRRNAAAQGLKNTVPQERAGTHLLTRNAYLKSCGPDAPSQC